MTSPAARRIGPVLAAFVMVAVAACGSPSATNAAANLSTPSGSAQSTSSDEPSDSDEPSSTARATALPTPTGQRPTPTAGQRPTPTAQPIPTPAAKPHGTVRYEVTGTANAYTINYDPAESSADGYLVEVPLPFARNVPDPGARIYQVVAVGRAEVGCRILIDGRVVAEQPLGGSGHCVYEPKQ